MTPCLLRWTKILITLAMGIFGLLVSIANLNDPSINFAYVQHILLMDNVFPDSKLRSRALGSHTVHLVFMGVIIISELLFTLCCLAGAWQMWRQRRGDPQAFHRAKRFAVMGCLIGLLIWYFCFQVVGGEWFLMWQSTQWNGLASAARMSEFILGMLIFISLRNDD